VLAHGLGHHHEVQEVLPRSRGLVEERAEVVEVAQRALVRELCVEPHRLCVQLAPQPLRLRIELRPLTAVRRDRGDERDDDRGAEREDRVWSVCDAPTTEPLATTTTATTPSDVAWVC
jgi:hypothetical protein